MFVKTKFHSSTITPFKTSHTLSSCFSYHAFDRKVTIGRQCFVDTTFGFFKRRNKIHVLFSFTGVSSVYVPFNACAFVIPV